MVKKRSDRIMKMIAVLFFVISVACAAAIGILFISPGEESVQQYCSKKTVTGSSLGVNTDNPIDWESLKEKNPDVYAWLRVPGTVIDYPVLQAKQGEDEDFYLHHNISGDYSFAGSIYSRKENARDFSDPITVLYGHNMLNGSMFAAIKKFADRHFFDEHDQFVIYRPGKVLTYRIIAYYQTDDTSILNKYDNNDRSEVQTYFNTILNSGGNVRSDSSIQTDDHIVTLSTCFVGKQRRLLQGLLIRTESEETT